MPPSPFVRLGPWLVVLACVSGAACLPSRQLSTSIFGAHYRSHPVQVFSMGLGRLPDGGGQGPYLHLRLAVNNPSAQDNVFIDPREQVLWLVPNVPLKPAFADCGGQSGVITVPPRRYQNVDLFYLVPEGIDEAVLAWSLAASDGTRTSERLAVVGLPTRSGAPHLALWVPKDPGEGTYDVTSLEAWAAPTPSWYWWRDGDFPAWTSQDLTLTATERPAIEFGSEMWSWGEPTASAWWTPPLHSEVSDANDQRYMPAGRRGSVTSASPRSFTSGWRRRIRPPAPEVRAAPSRVSDEAEYEPSSSSAPSPPSSPRPSAARTVPSEPQSTASPVGRSWRDKR